MQSSPWQLDGYRARFALDELAGSVDLLQPGAGLELRWRDRAYVTAFAIELPQVDPTQADSILDAWIRENDLVANYVECAPRTTRGQIYWRLHRHGDIAAPAIDLIASVNTSLLDSDPTLNVRTGVTASEVLQLRDAGSNDAEIRDVSERELVLREHSGSPACFLFRLCAGASTYVEMVHPADFTESALVRLPSGEVELSSRLFRGRLEKGVILRSRLRTLFVPRDNDVELAHACYADFAASEPPLTA